MSWYYWRWGRFAFSRSRQGTMIDVNGRWRHVLGALWYLTDTIVELLNDPSRVDP